MLDFQRSMGVSSMVDSGGLVLRVLHTYVGDEVFWDRVRSVRWTWISATELMRGRWLSVLFIRRVVRHRAPSCSISIWGLYV